MSPFGTQQTFDRSGRSLCRKTDMSSQRLHVRLWPKADIGPPLENRARRAACYFSQPEGLRDGLLEVDLAQTSCCGMVLKSWSKGASKHRNSPPGCKRRTRTKENHYGQSKRNH